jgi:hypothetical protein
MSPKEDRRLTRLTSICLALPEATRESWGRHAGFVVRKRKFAYWLDDHHGDGIVSVCIKALPGQQDMLLAWDTTRFYRPAYIGRQGWVGLRLDRGPIDWGEVEALVTDSYRVAAPKRLAARLAPPPSRG